MQNKEPKTAVILVRGSQIVFQDKSKKFKRYESSNLAALNYLFGMCGVISSVENISILFNDRSRSKEFIFTFKMNICYNQ